MGIHTASLMRSADRVHSSGVECPGCTRYLYSLSFCQVHLESVDDWFRARSQVRSSLSGFRLENVFCETAHSDLVGCWLNSGITLSEPSETASCYLQLIPSFETIGVWTSDMPAFRPVNC